MPLTDTSRYRWPSQQHRLEFDLGDARNFYLADVDSDGSDGANFPVLADEGGAVAIVTAFDGVTSFGSIQGSVQAGGFTADLTIDEYPADFSDWFETTLYIRGWLGGVPGIPGAGGIEQGRVVLFRGYMQTVSGQRSEYGKSTTTFPVASSSAFLKSSSFSRGIDWADGLPHGAPGTSNTIIAHLLTHTNLEPRSPVGIYLPDHSLTRFTCNEGSVLGMLQQLADNFTGQEGWVFCRRNDDLFIGCHPNLDRDDLHPTKNDPVVEIDTDLMLGLEVPEVPPRAVASVTVVAQKSDQTEYVKTAFNPGGLGSRVKRTIVTDDETVVDWLASALVAHLNRRYQAVKVTVPLVGVTVDLGDCILLTTSVSQRAIAWEQKKFVVTAIEYRPDLQTGAFQAVLTCDEVL